MQFFFYVFLQVGLITIVSLTSEFLKILFGLEDLEGYGFT